MGVSIAYGCLPQNLLIVKLEAHELNRSFILMYLTLKKQRSRTDSSWSNRTEIFWVIPQYSSLGQLFFNIFINDIFFFVEK